MSHLPIKALCALEATVRLGAVTRAADELHVTHSAVSHQLKSLEDWFGRPLLEKRGRGVIPTPGARELAELIKESLVLITAGCERLRRERAAPAVTVACIPSFATHRIIPLLPHFMECHPKIQVRLIYALSQTPVLLPEADLVVRSHDGGYHGPGVGYRLLSGAVRPLCSPRLISRLGPFSRPADILRAPLLHDADRMSWANWFAASGIRSADLLSGPIFEDFHLLSKALLDGQGVALCPDELLGDEIEQGTLVQLFSLSTHTDRAYWLFHHDRCSRSATVFRDWIVNAMRIQRRSP